jgi:hypothetical protein
MQLPLLALVVVCTAEAEHITAETDVEKRDRQSLDGYGFAPRLAQEETPKKP